MMIRDVMGQQVRIYKFIGSKQPCMVEQTKLIITSLSYCYRYMTFSAKKKGGGIKIDMDTVVGKQVRIL